MFLERIGVGICLMFTLAIDVFETVWAEFTILGFESW